MNPKLKMLCELYDRSDEDINVDALLKVCFFKSIKEVLYLISNKQRVKFAYLCAKSVSHLCDKKVEKKVKKCLELVGKWLENTNSVSHEELRNIANVIYDSITFIFYDASSFAAVDATNSAASVARYVDDCNVSGYVNYAAGYAIDAAKNKREQKYKNLGFLVKVIKGEE